MDYNRVVIIFGSKSDFNIYDKLFNLLKKRNIQCIVKTLSAHRQPQEVKEFLGIEKPKLVIAGAGLSAALPGFVATNSNAFVIGIPVTGNYNGLDALLSVHQMPANVIVCGVGINNTNEAASYIEMIIKRDLEKIVLIKRNNSEAVVNAIKKAEQALNEQNIQYEIINEAKYISDKTIYIDFVELGKVKDINTKGRFVLFVPVKLDSNERDALKLMELTKKGLWVGLNRGENAALASIKILKLQ